MNRRIDLLQQVRVYLEEKGMRLMSCDDGTIRATIAGRSLLFQIQVYALDDPLLLGVAALVPLIVPEPRRTAMAETIARANNGLEVGSFQFDVSAGIIRYRATTVPVDDGFDSEALDVVLQSVMATTDRYFPAFARLLYGDDLSPAEVIAEVEMAEAD